MYRFLVQLSLIFLMAGCTNVPGHKDEMPSVVCVGDYGAAGDGVTDDTEAIRKALAAAIKAKGAVLKFEPKVYRLKETKNSWFHFEIHNVRDLTIDGCGATLLSTPTNQVFSIVGCRNVTVSNLSIDYFPKPYTQAEITSVEQGSGSFVINTLDGYPANILDYRYGKEQGRFHGWSHCVVMNPDLKTRNETMPHDHLYIANAEQLSRTSYRITVQDKYVASMKGMKAGDCAVIGLGYLLDYPYEQAEVLRKDSFGWQSCFYINTSSDVTVNNVRLYCTPGRWLRITDNYGTVRISDSYWGPHPDTDEIASTILDGIHAKNNRGKVIIRNCHFQGAMDDLVNCCQMTEFVSEVHSQKEVTFVNTDHNHTLFSMDAGNELVFVKKYKGKILGTARIKEIVETNGRKNRVILDSSIPGLVAAPGKADPEAVIAMNYGRASSGFEITGNTFVPILRRALAVYWTDGVISDNVLDCRGGGSIWMMTSANEFYGPFIRNLQVRNNTVRNSYHISIQAGAMWPASVANPDVYDAGLVIENNVIESQKGAKPAIRLANMRNVVLRGNTVSMENPSQNQTEIINCENITTE